MTLFFRVILHSFSFSDTNEKEFIDELLNKVRNRTNEKGTFSLTD